MRATRWIVVVLAVAVGLGGCGDDGDSTFSDPQGAYTMKVSEDWVAHHGSVAPDIEAWAVAETRDGFAPNLNVITQQVGADVDIEAYLDASLRDTTALNQLQVIKRDTITGDGGRRLGALEYSAVEDGRSLRFLGIVAINAGKAVLITLTAPPDAFDDVRREVEPYMRTIRPT